VAEAVAGYAAARRTRLPVSEDASAQLAGQDPVWEVAANQLAGVFGRAWRPLRLVAVDRLCRELLASDTPSVVDGRMSPRSWSVSGNRLVKLDAAERAYSSRNLATADAAYDVAGAAVAWPVIADTLRAAFARRTGEEVDEERWLVLRLVAIWAAERDGDMTWAEARRARARVLQDYFAALYLADLPVVADGPLCALDIDGVLETSALGVPALSPASGRALRALRAHGHRVVLASGRSASDVADRVRAYGLAGGVAEYGAVLLDDRGTAEPILPAAAQEAVDRGRAALEELPGVEIEAAYRASVRAWRRDADGLRRALAPDAEAAALTAGGVLRAVRGDDQTDLVPVGVDKGAGLRRFADGALALAVGDTVEDLPMLALAELAAVPAHARRLRDGHVRAMRRPYQAGLEQAVAKLLGHAPGGCPACALPPATRERRLLLRALAAPERGRVGMALAAVGLVAGVRR
jgi:hydroxymethylpyrimidine pyrophosphatase-like HAD family hydrolase